MGRSVVGTTVGGAAEFVPSGAGVLVDPGDAAALAAALERAAAMPSPNPAAREAATKQDVQGQVARMAAVLERAAAGR
jgi:glycosyltransferase involved in cell wall biosynthesis